MNTFKVVFIYESKELEPVPHQWECNGQLYWPPTKRLLRANQSNARSVPGKDWLTYKCVVKESDILIYSDASKRADELCELDSSADEAFIGSKRKCVLQQTKQTYNEYFSQPVAMKSNIAQPDKPILNRPNVVYSPAIKLNQSVDETCGTNYDQSLRYLPPYLNDSESNILSLEVNESVHTVTEEGLDETVPLCSLIPSSDLSKMMDMFLELKLNMAQKLEEICNLQMNTQQSLAEVSAKQDRLEKLIVTHSEELMQDKRIDDQTGKVFPLDSVEDVKQCEENLKDDVYRHKVIAHLKRVNGAGQPWRNASYNLSSILFTKKILTMYSWTGVSRTNIMKEPFNKLVNILDTFYQVVYFADNTFSHKNKESFFRDSILKHSISRLYPKRKDSTVTINTLDNANVGCEDDVSDGIGQSTKDSVARYGLNNEAENYADIDD